MPGLFALAMMLATVAATACYFGFTADDAYIVARYANNLSAGRGLVFNAGEHVSALTSPAHALLVAALARFAADPIIPYKVLAAGAVALTLGLASRRVRDPYNRLLFLLLTACSPFVIMWTVGGLETPMLLVVVTWLARLGFEQPSARSLLLATLFGSVAFVVRHDSILFSAPIIAALGWPLLRGRSIAPLHALPLAIPLAWLIFARVYYGDLLPTSFYDKVPGLQPRVLLHGALYELNAWFFSGFAFLAAGAIHAWRRGAMSALRARPWLVGYVVGIALVLAYGVSVSAKHMMFGYRLFVPYLPAIALLAIHLMETAPSPPRRALTPIAIAALQIGVFFIVEFVTINPAVGQPWLAFEYPRLGLRSYARDFLGAQDANAAAIAAHWRSTSTGAVRAPRIVTYAAGRVPFTIGDAYVYESLVSYRHHCRRRSNELPEFADYTQIIVPYHGTREEQLGSASGRAILVGAHETSFDGRLVRFEVWFNPHPGRFTLPSRTSDRGPCLSAAQEEPTARRDFGSK